MVSAVWWAATVAGSRAGRERERCEQAERKGERMGLLEGRMGDDGRRLGCGGGARVAEAMGSASGRVLANPAARL